LKRIGGLDLKDETNRILGAVFGQPVAEIISKTGKGQGKKFGFMKLNCSDLIICKLFNTV
jgi:hypothetical protein